MEYILIFIAAVFVNNVVLSQFLGICPFLGVSKKVDTAIGMGAAVAFVLTIATLVTFLVQKYVLDAIRSGLYADYQLYLDHRKLWSKWWKSSPEKLLPSHQALECFFR